VVDIPGTQVGGDEGVFVEVRCGQWAHDFAFRLRRGSGLTE
jgi:hypothetical protein